MIKKLSFLFSIFLFSVCGYCQSEVYKNGIGVIGGLNSGISLKHLIVNKTGDVFTNTSAIEVMLTSRWKGLSVGVVYEVNIASDYKSSFVWNVGGGARVGSYNMKNRSDSMEDKREILIGLLATLGTEYIFAEKPFSIGLNYIPFFDLKGQDNSYVDFMFSVRYLFY